MRADPNDPDMQFLKAYYGLEDFPYEQFICQTLEMKKIFYISKTLSDYLYSDPS